MTDTLRTPWGLVQKDDFIIVMEDFGPYKKGNYFRFDCIDDVLDLIVVSDGEILIGMELTDATYLAPMPHDTKKPTSGCPHNWKAIRLLSKVVYDCALCGVKKEET